MKKAKVMLLAIAIVGVIGSALAFKATKFAGRVWLCTTTINSPQVAICTQPGFITTVAGKGFPTIVYSTTTSTLGTCPNTLGAETIYCINSSIAFITANAGE